MSRIMDLIDNFIGIDRIGDYQSIVDLIKSVPQDKIADFQLSAAKSLPTVRRIDSRFQYVASHSLSGYPYPCRSSSCRLSKLQTIASFSAIYSDQSVLFNPFNHCINTYSESNKKLAIHSIYNLAVSISEVIFLKPLIERNIVTFTNYEKKIHVCPKCLSKIINEETKSSEKIDYFDVINKYISNNSDITFRSKNSEGYQFEIRGDVELYEHNSIYRTVKKIPPSYSDIEPGTKIDKEFIYDTGFFASTCHNYLSEHLEKLKVKKDYGINGIFSSSLEMSLLSKLFGDEFKSQNFDATLPFLSSGKLDSILDIRDSEWHHFEEFRSRFFKTVNLIGPGHESAEEIYRSEILPEMIKLEKIIEKNKNQAGKKLIEGSSITGLSILSSVLTSGISDIIPIASSILGAGHFSKSMMPQLQKRLSIPDAAKESGFYYAWKIKKGG